MSDTVINLAAWRAAHATAAPIVTIDDERATVTIELTDWTKADLRELATHLWVNGVQVLAVDIMEEVGLPDDWADAS